MNKKILLSIILSLAILSANSANAIGIHISGRLTPEIKKNINLMLSVLTDQANKKTYAETSNFTQLIKKKIIEATSPFGYFSPTIKIIKQNNTFNFNIKLNQPVIIKSVNIRIQGPGTDDPHFKRYLHEIPLHSGMILSIKKYQQVKNKLYSIAANQGYFKAKMTTSKININLAKKTASIHIILNSGKRYQYGDTTFSKTELNKTFLQRFISYKKGDLYQNNKLEKTQLALTNSGYFQQAIITPEPSKIHHNRVPIHIYLVPVTKKSYTFGFGYGTDTGLRGLANISNNYLNGKGHRFKVIGQIAQKSQNITATYTIPGYKLNHHYTLTGALSQFSINQNQSRAMKLSLGSTHVFSHWENIISLNALDEAYSLTDISTQATLLYPKLHIEYKNLDHPMKTNNGLILNFNLVGAPQLLSSTAPFIQISSELRAVKTIQASHTRLLIRGQIATTNIDSINHLPLSLQLFAGGAQSIRGYEFDSIGHGKNLFTASSEIQQKIYKSFYVVGFFDTGNVSDVSNIFKNPYSSIGTGIAWLSPIGVLEFTVANPLSNHHSKSMFQFSMGAYL